MVHPDKHPIENYQIAQAHFKEIDEAYKSISSDLRRYVYKHYGSTGITIVENNQFLFQEFEKADLDDPLILNVCCCSNLEIEPDPHVLLV